MITGEMLFKRSSEKKVILLSKVHKPQVFTTIQLNFGHLFHVMLVRIRFNLTEITSGLKSRLKSRINQKYGDLFFTCPTYS